MRLFSSPIIYKISIYALEGRIMSCSRSLKWVETRFDVNVPAYYGWLFHVERGNKLKVKFMEDVKKIGLVIYTSLSHYQLHFGNTLKNYGLNKVWELTKITIVSQHFKLSYHLFTTICNSKLVSCYTDGNS